MLTDKIASYFNAGVRSRGDAYFRGGQVHLGNFDDAGEITALVVGSSVYTVSIEFDCATQDWRLWTDCGCPYMASDDGFCKHIWATLLAIEKNKADELNHRFGELPKKISVDFLDHDEELNEYELTSDDWGADDDPTEDEDQRERRFGNLGDNAPWWAESRGQQSPKKKSAPTPAWQEFLRQIPSHDHQAYAPRTTDDSPIVPIYVLDATETRYAEHPVLRLTHQQITTSGKLGKIKRLTLSTRDISRIPDKLDRRICMLLLGASALDGGSTYYGRYGYESVASQWELPDVLQKELLPLLADTDRLMLCAEHGATLTPLMWDGNLTWELVLSIRKKGGSSSYTMQALLRHGDDYHRLDELACFIPGSPALFVYDNTLCQFLDHGCFAWLDILRGRESISLRKSDLSKFLEEISRLRAFPPIEWPEDWNVTEIHALAPQPEILLTIEDPRSRRGSLPARGEANFHYGEISVNALNPGQMLVNVREKQLIRRQLETERELLNRLRVLGARDTNGDEFDVPPRKIPALVSTLVTEGWIVRGNQKLYRRPGEFKINVSSGVDWFDVAGQVDFDGQAAQLPELLAALQKGDKFVRLGDGSLGLLPEQWLARHQRWLELGHAEDGQIRFSHTQLSLIDALLAEMPEATFDRNIAAARKKLARFSGVKPRKEPNDFCGELRVYQRECLGWLRFLDDFNWGGCLADDMGLGKTVQVLALLADKRRQGAHGPSLVAAPKSVVFNWLREAERFAPKLRVLDYTGSERKQTRDTLTEHDLVLTTYGTLRRDIEFLRQHQFNYVVLDEAQAIKNPTSQSAKATRLLQARRRLALTGTPVENELSDLWSLFEFLNPGMLGAVKAFQAFAGVGRNGDQDQAQLATLQHAVRPFVLRRTKEQVAPELPQRSEQTIHCELPAKEAAYYKELRDHYRASLLHRVDEVGLARSKMHVLEALLRLRQAACHPGLIDESKRGAGSAKLDTLLAMVTELIEEGHKALIFSQFTQLLALVRQELDPRGVTYEYLDGKTRKREQRIDRFQNDPACPLFLISLKAGGAGLNLTAADYVFILDPWWNPAVEAQAIDRAHRIGQEKKVIAYRLIARDTVEAKILELQQSKRELAEAIITQQNSVVRSLTREDLAALLT